jgi:hypothetical protein
VAIIEAMLPGTSDCDAPVPLLAAAGAFDAQ